MRILVTGAAGNAGQAVCQLLKQKTPHELRMCDVNAPPAMLRDLGEYIRCDTRTREDVEAVMAGVDCVVHLAAWHCGHKPPVSDETIFAVNVDGTFNVIQAARRHDVKALVFASSMAYGLGGVYGATKVLGEDLCRMFFECTQKPTISLRYHDFVPKPYLAFGNKLLFNGVDRRDVAAATVASVEAALAGRVSYFMTIVHHQLGAPADVVNDFGRRGQAWLEAQVPGATRLMQKYDFKLPERLEQHDLSEAAKLLHWKPEVNFLSFMRDLQRREAAGEDVTQLWTTGEIPTSAA